VRIKKNIVLRNIPKVEIQLDLWPYQITGGFRGFSSVHRGLHFITFQDKGETIFEWLFISNETIVKQYDHENLKLVDSEIDGDFNYIELADSGLMSENLIAHPSEASRQWLALTSYITVENFNLIRVNPSMDFIRNNKTEYILAHYQTSYVKMILVPSKNRNTQDWGNWILWIEFFHQFSSGDIKSNKDLFKELIELFIIQFTILPEDYRSEVQSIVKNSIKLIQNMEETEDVDLILKANRYKFFHF